MSYPIVLEHLVERLPADFQPQDCFSLIPSRFWIDPNISQHRSDRPSGNNRRPTASGFVFAIEGGELPLQKALNSGAGDVQLMMNFRSIKTRPSKA